MQNAHIKIIIMYVGQCTISADLHDILCIDYNIMISWLLFVYIALFLHIRQYGVILYAFFNQQQ